MSEAFFGELDLPEPDFNLEMAGLRHGAMTVRMPEKLETVLVEESPDVVLIDSDTNSTLTGALAASKVYIPVAHVDAGLRSRRSEWSARSCTMSRYTSPTRSERRHSVPGGTRTLRWHSPQTAFDEVALRTKARPSRSATAVSQTGNSIVKPDNSLSPSRSPTEPTTLSKT